MAEIEATAGAQDANSYIDLEDADAWFDDGLRAARWVTFPAAQRARALIDATRAIERLALAGAPANADQALHFPRTTDRDGAALVLPEGIVHATAEQALHLLEQAANPELLDHRGLQQQGVRYATMDGVVVNYRGAGPEANFSPDAWDYLRPFTAVTARIPTRGKG